MVGNPNPINEKKHVTTEQVGSRRVSNVGIGFGGNFLTWLLLMIFMIYILYSSTLLLTSEKKNCDDHRDLNLSVNKRAKTSQRINQYIVPKSQTPLSIKIKSRSYGTEIKHIAFGIASSSSLWEKRKEYIKQWWQPKVTRGVVWLDRPVKATKNDGLPKIRISSDTSNLPYKNQRGRRSALRISRIVSEMVRLRMPDVRWYVMGDDDTVFVPENLVRVLDKYDPTQFFYIGSSSESHKQNMLLSSVMAYGGGGFAISHPLAKELEKMQDQCINRYPTLYGSDERVHACLAEIGVPLTREPGFHQYDVHGNLMGLLLTHPITPLTSLHHIDAVEALFPTMNRVQSLQHLFKSVEMDSASILQQSICYDKKKQWSISVSWGYAVQVIRGIVPPRELEIPPRTFLNWDRRNDYTSYAFNTRPLFRHPCQKPFIFYMRTARYDRSKRRTESIYKLHNLKQPMCQWNITSPAWVETIVVTKKTNPLRWNKSPRRDCCRVISSGRRSNMFLSVGRCEDGEISTL